MKKKGKFQKNPKNSKIESGYSPNPRKKKQSPKLKRPFLKTQKNAFLTTLVVGVKDVIWKIGMKNENS